MPFANRHPCAALLAGLAAGVLGALGMLVWLGVSAAWQSRSFWTAPNLMATIFYGDAAIHSGFAHVTVSGLALYVVVYGLLGALFATAAAAHVRGLRAVLVAAVFGLAWYYFAFGLIGPRFSPLVVLLHPQRPHVVGHLIYGSILGRFGNFLPRTGAEMR